MKAVGRLSFISLFVTLVVVAAFGAGYLVAHRFPIAAVSAQAPADVQADFQVFWQVWNLVRDDFVDKARAKPVAMTRGAIRGMLAALEDPHTAYISPEQFRSEKDDLRGQFEGIGAQVKLDENDILTVVKPLDGSPALKAGLREGDQILKVDGEEIPSTLALTERVNKIRGPKGTPVTLTIRRSGQDEPFDLTIVRGEVDNPSVAVDEPSPGIARIRIRTFGGKTDQEVERALRDPLVQNARGLILDLRGNPGGLLDVTVRIAGQFLDGGLVLTQEDGGGGRTVWNDDPGGLATTVPLVILVNAGSASGSEVLSGALRDYNRAKLIGEKTFGKGSVNHVYELQDQGALYLTFARWRTPNGTLIEGQGLTPDIEVKMTAEVEQKQGDIQLKRAIDELSK